MKDLIAMAMVLGLIITPFVAYAQSEQAAAEAPPVSQQLVPEGDFALKLATALKLGTPTTEAQAEYMLATVGIAPKNGWIADYPMTPIIIGQVRNTVVAAAALNKLPMGKDEALQAFEGLTAEFGLAFAVGPEQYTEGQPPSESEYLPPPVINDYYNSEGPPVITYYPPPWDYSYLYGWVPYPFWWSSFFFSGFFILNDFHHHHGHHLVSNHFVDPATHASVRVDPTTRTRGTALTRTSGRTGSPEFASPAARTGAASILNRSASSTRMGDPGRMGRSYRGSPNTSTGSVGSYRRSFSSPSGRTLSAPSTGGGPGSFRRFHDGSYSRGFQNPSTSSSRSYSRSSSSPSGRSFSAPSASGPGSFGGFRDGSSFGGFRGGSGLTGSHGGGYAGGGGFSGNSQGGGFGGSHGGGHR
jgi:hypothetical protein